MSFVSFVLFCSSNSPKSPQNRRFCAEVGQKYVLKKNKKDYFQGMRHYGLPEKYIRIFQAFFNGTMSAVKVNGELTDWFDVNSGTGQGDIQGPPVFNFCLNFAAFMAEANKNISHGIVLQKEDKKSKEKVVLDTDYADDMAIMDNSTDGLQECTDLLAHYCSYAGLRINAC